MQLLYMPSAITSIEGEEDAWDCDMSAPTAEEVKLWLPSQVPLDERLFVCEDAFFNAEFRLWEGQCSDTLASLRSKLMARQHLIWYRNSNVVGQQMSTRARTIIDTVSDRIDTAAARYRCGRDAMAQLCGKEGCSQYRLLMKEDITAVQLQEGDAKATKRLGKVGS